MGEELGLSPEEMGLPPDDPSLKTTESANPESTLAQTALQDPEQERDNDGGDPGESSDSDGGSEGTSSQTELANAAASKIASPKPSASSGAGGGPGILESGKDLIGSIGEELPNIK